MWARLAFALIAVVVVLAAIGTLVLLVMQSEWFRKQVAKGIVDTVEDATGGRVELQSFHYNWRELTAEARGFVLHGTEPAGAPVLFRAASLKVRIKILSVVKRDIDLASLVVERPEFNLIVNEDGTTNFPEPKVKRVTSEPLLEQLINLRVKHFELNHGTATINLKEFPLEIAGENLRLVTTYDPGGPRYRARMSAEKLRLAVPGVLPLGGECEVDATMERDAIRFSSIRYQTDQSVVTASGTLRHLAHPSLNLAAKAHIDVREAGKMVGVPQLNNGQMEFDGALKYTDTGLVLTGRTRAEHVRYQEPDFAVPDARLTGDLVLTANKVTLKRLAAYTLGAELVGEAELDRYRDLRIDGQVSNLDTAAVGPLLLQQPLAWHGIASGPVHVKAMVAGRPNATVDAELAIAPGTQGIPVQGHAGIHYRYQPEELAFNNTTLQFPHSEVTLSGTVGERLTAMLDTSSVNDLLPAFQLASAGKSPELPFQMLEGGHLHFAGDVKGKVTQLVVEGKVDAEHVRLEGQVIDRLTSEFEANASRATVKSVVAEQGPLRLRAQGAVGLTDWTQRKSSSLDLSGQIQGADLATFAEMADLPKMQGTASATFDIHGTALAPQGKVHVEVRQFVAYGQAAGHVTADLTATGDEVNISKVTAVEGKTTVEAAARFRHPPGIWKNGELDATLRTVGFQLKDCQACSELLTGWSGTADANASFRADVQDQHFEIRAADGQVALRDVARGSLKVGNVTLRAYTAQGDVEADFDSRLHGSRITGSFKVGMTTDYPVQGNARVDQISLSAVREMFPEETKQLPFDAALKTASVKFHGALAHLDQMDADATVESFEIDPNIPATARGVINPEELILRNAQAINLNLRKGQLEMSPTKFVARDTSLVVGGSAPLVSGQGMNATVEGSLNLQVFQLFDPNVVSSGISTLRVKVSGPLDDPSISGTLDLRNAAFHLDKFPNGLDRANGTIRFDNHRATIQRLTAHSGGGSLSVDGFVTFGQGGPIVYRLEGRATDVRVRYASAVSVTSTASVRFVGTSERSLLSGTITVNRAAFDPSADLGALFAETTAPVASPSSESDIFRGIQMDLQVVSGPNFQLSTSLSQDVEADIDLRLRGSPALPSVLGRISVRQGQIQVFGNKYTISRGEIAFFNPAKIEPVLDVDLETQVRSITASITITGTPSKLNVNYRSDPPLQPSEIIALLAVGRTPETVSSLANTQMTNNNSAFTSGANTLLGQALSPVSSRLERLFGVTHIKIDPLVQGLDNSTQARLTLEQQVSRDISITYITNLTHTTEQIFRFEWTLSKQYSIVGLRDENGAFGMDLLYKKQFK